MNTKQTTYHFYAEGTGPVDTNFIYTEEQIREGLSKPEGEITPDDLADITLSELSSDGWIGIDKHGVTKRVDDGVEVAIVIPQINL